MTRYNKGDVIRETEAAIFAILYDGMVYHADKLQNAGFMKNWSVHLIEREVRQGRIFRAVKVEWEDD
ncbi:hypothetical protein [Microcystis phage Mwe-JY13]